MAPEIVTALRAFHGDPALKAALLHEIGLHEAQDMILHGTYGKGTGCEFRGCAIGCSLHSLNKIQGKTEPERDTGVHARYPAELGLPLWLAYFEDNVFEELPMDQAKTWPRRFTDAIPVGAVVDDLVLAKILRWSLGAETYGARYAATDPPVVAVVDRMVALFDRAINGDEPSVVEWNEAAGAAGAAARAARDARDAWAAGAAGAARAAWAAGAAGAAARDAWAALAARDAWAAGAAGAAGAARAARAAWAAGAARAARAAWAAGAAGAARAAWAAGAAGAAFYPALSEYVLSLLRELPVGEQVVAHG